MLIRLPPQPQQSTSRKSLGSLVSRSQGFCGNPGNLFPALSPSLHDPELYRPAAFSGVWSHTARAAMVPSASWLARIVVGPKSGPKSALTFKPPVVDSLW